MAEPVAHVLGSFALLAYLGGEAGSDRIAEVLLAAADGNAGVAVSLISIGEVLYITERALGLPAAQAALALIDSLPLRELAADRDAVLAAAHIKAGNRLSYANASVVAAANSTGGVVLTGDPEFQYGADQVADE